MKLTSISFSNDEFKRFSSEESAFITVLAHVRNDIRHLNLLIMSASKGVLDANLEEKIIALHHYQHLFRLLASSLFEGWELIRTNWHGSGIGKVRSKILNQEGKNGLKFMKKYFGNRTNHITRIRNKVGFHYDTETVKPVLNNQAELEHRMMTGNNAQNTFFSFSSTVMNCVIFDIKSSDDLTLANSKIQTIGDNIISLMDAFINFSDDYLVAVINELQPTFNTVEVSKGIDPRKLSPIVIVSNNQI